MTFVTADSCRVELERLTKLLVSSFPGSTVYQHTDLFRVSHDVLHNRVDAVFLKAETEKASGLDVLQMLRRQKPELLVYILSETDHLREKAVEAGASGFFVLPASEQQLLDTIRSAKTRSVHHDD